MDQAFELVPLQRLMKGLWSKYGGIKIYTDLVQGCNKGLGAVHIERLSIQVTFLIPSKKIVEKWKA